MRDVGLLEPGDLLFGVGELAWLLSRPGVTAPIVGATRLGHISDALAAGQLTLTEEEITRLEEPYVPHPVLAHR